MSLKDNKKLILPIIYIICGVLFIIFRQQVVSWICSAFGAIIICIGIINLLDATKFLDQNVKSLKITSSIITIIIGALVVIFAWVVTSIIIWVLAIYFIIYGATIITKSVAKEIKNIPLIYGILYLATGILLIFDNKIVYIVLGSLLVLAGIFELYTLLKRQNKSTINKVDAIEGTFTERK